MKTLKTLFIITAAVFMIAGCKKDNGKSDPLLGTWQKKIVASSGDVQVEEYKFKSDGTFELRSAIANSSNQVLGYTYRTVGTYTVSKDQLTLNISTTYTKDDASQGYVAIDKLVSHPPVFQSLSYTVAYNATVDSLSLTIHCPPNADCIGGETWYQKQ
ncbi:hypothetical protein [Mucilaginibacter sp. KACC 22063]|uniref:hypothetical protein n=1 Tax=Mucilaginibacter sp. KACC 22063 TaxID=3025666 RepID=UPI00236520AC|nr:hypothetical protein [Mucilaginibacter sp. KACC 22063]WDF55725.1 hypothetical protein PQ461_01455 [Mucilaginibacter sp. KACC 22063]